MTAATLAGGLSDAGLPQGHIPLALLFLSGGYSVTSATRTRSPVS